MASIYNLFAAAPYRLGYATVPEGDVLVVNPANTGLLPINQPSKAPTPIQPIVDAEMVIQPPEENPTTVNVDVYFIPNSHVSCSVFLAYKNAGVSFTNFATPPSGLLGSITITFQAGDNPQIPMPSGGMAALNNIPVTVVNNADAKLGDWLASMKITYNNSTKLFYIMGSISFQAASATVNPLPATAGNRITFGTFTQDNAPKFIYLGDYATVQ
jgi:hypothetical protein